MKTVLKSVGVSLLIGFLLGSQAHAMSGGERRSVLVNIAGFDLRTEAGRDLVYWKLKAAAKQACIDMRSRHHLAKPMLYSQCVNEAITAAVHQVPDAVFRQHAAQR